MMQCTPQEIELKRRQAQERLSKKNLISNINSSSSNQVNFGGTTSFPKNFPSTSASNSVSPLRNYSRPQQNATRSPSYMSRTGKGGFNNYSKPYEKPNSALAFYGKNNVITGTCALIAEDRFVVEMLEFCVPAIEVFKTIPSRLYNQKTKQWNFHASDYELVFSKLALLQPDVVVSKLPVYVLNCFKMPPPKKLLIDLSCIDQELLNSLMPFQEEGVYFGIDKGGRCLIADEMGLGKTFQALAIASYYKSDWPVLIATTASMRNIWEETIHKYMPSVSVMHTHHMESRKDYIGDAKMLIVSHDMMKNCLKILQERNFGIFIVDESHTLKNYKTKCTMAATALAKQAKRVILLSGTPALSRPNELYTQLSILDDRFFGNFFEYSKRYCDGKTSAFGWDSSGQSNLQELEIVLAKRFMIRRTKEDVLKALPNKKQEVVTLDVNLNQFSDEDRKCLNALAENYNRQKKSVEKHRALLTFFSETAKMKIPSVCSYILQTLEQTPKFLVFAHHKIMLDAMERVLEKKKKKFIRIDGSTTSDQRRYLVDKFQVDDNYICAILSITAANAGITLTAAQLVLFAELHWNPSILSQAESRAHRIGQEGVVVVRYLLAPGTADDHIWPILQDKQKILKEAGLFKDSFANVTVTAQDLTNKEPIAECLQSQFTSAKTLDITNYFISPTKKGDTDKEKCVRNNNKSLSESFLDAEAQMDFLNDDFDFESPNISSNSGKVTGSRSISEDLLNISSENFFNDDFTFSNQTKTKLINKEGCHENRNSAINGNADDISDFLNDDYDDILSRVEVNT